MAPELFSHPVSRETLKSSGLACRPVAPD